MTSQKEQDELRGIFGRDIEIKDLKLGELIYLKDSLDKRVRRGMLQTVSNIRDLVDTDTIKIAFREGYNWRNQFTVDKLYSMKAEEILYLDLLVRLNEIHKDLSYSELKLIS